MDETRVDSGQPYLRRGLGLACAHKNVGFSYGYPENCTIGIDLYGAGEIERAVIRHGASEVGMGAHTVITQMAAEVVVDMETGLVKIEKIYCAIDVGKAINPQQVVGQIQGGLVQSVGYAVMENFIEKEGQVLTPGLSTYLVPTVLDIPGEMNIMVLEIPDPRGPWGARGLGEVMNMCLAPAVTAAVYDATGVWFDRFPLVPEEVLKGIAHTGKK